MERQTAFQLPRTAADSLGDPKLKLVLHCITFSHYCERARWTLRLLGIPYEEMNYLPLQHIPGILRLQRLFKQPPGPATASSKSPAATPCLALYDCNGQPLCLLQDSALICRYAVLRASALGLPQAADLYGSSLALGSTDAAADAAAAAAAAAPDSSAGRSEPESPAEPKPAAAAAAAAPSGPASTGRGGVAVHGGSDKVVQLEQRLGGTLGIEARRIAYYHLLPLSSVGGALFTNNSSSALLGRVIYWLCRLLLPSLLQVNAATAARGRERLLAEFDYLDSLLQQQQQQHPAHDGSDARRLPHYLLGLNMSVADIQLACLAAPVLCVPAEHSTTWMPPLDALPEDLRAFVEELRQRPTGRFVLELWRLHGPHAST